MSATTRPDVRQVGELPALQQGSVLPEFIDVNGHMNIRHYLEYGAVSADVVCRDVGIDDDYRAQRRMGVFTAEHHIRYFSELHEGELLSAHARVLQVSGKAAHLMTFVVDRTHDVLACTVEIVLVHVDMDSRRPVAFPADVAAGWQRWVDREAELDWPAPVSGSMGIRR